MQRGGFENGVCVDYLFVRRIEDDMTCDVELWSCPLGREQQSCVVYHPKTLRSNSF